MSVIKQSWQNYSKLKYDLGKEYSSLTESHATEMSSLKARLAQGGLTTEDPTYSLRVNKLLADQMEAQESVTAARDELKDGAIKNVLTDPYFDDSYGTYVTGLANVTSRSEFIQGEREKKAKNSSYDTGSGNSYEKFSRYDLSVNKLNESGIEFQGMEEFYGAKYGEYTAPLEEVRAEKSANSMAQARGVSGGQRSKTQRRKPTGASIVGGNKFLGAASSLSGGSSGWWS